MKKNFMTILCIAFLFIGCKKTEITDPAENETGTTEGFGNRQCRLTRVAYGEDFEVRCYYNSKGLMNQWTNDYYDGFPDNFYYTYHNNGRLKSAHIDLSFSGEQYDIKFFYWGDRIIRELWTVPGSTDPVIDFRNTYNFRGWMTKRVDVINGNYSTFSYDFLGNSPVTLYYVDGELSLRGDYTYYRFNRNPWLATGHEYGIPYYFFTFTPWWETSEKITVYDAGVAEVLSDQDPVQTTWHYGPQFYLRDVHNFERVANEFTTSTFEYENCGHSHPDYTEPTTTSSVAKGHSVKRDLARIMKLYTLGKTKELKQAIHKMSVEAQAR